MLGAEKDPQFARVSKSREEDEHHITFSDRPQQGSYPSNLLSVACWKRVAAHLSALKEVYTYV
jgi:hypothetical protein